MNNAALAKMADELGAIDVELAPLRAKIKRAEGLRAALRGAFKDAPAGESFRVDGSQFAALLGPKGNESIVDRATLLELVGAPAFAALASVSLKALEGGCTADVVGAVVSTEMSGSRPLTIAVMTQRADRSKPVPSAVSVNIAPAPAAPKASKVSKRGKK